MREAFDRGEISAKRADEWLYLDPVEQEKRLAALLSERDTKARAYAVAANAIDSYLKERRGAKSVDLQELGRRIRAALAGGARQIPHQMSRVDAVGVLRVDEGRHSG